MFSRTNKNGAGYQNLESARKQLTKSIDELSSTVQGTPFQHNGSPEIALLKAVCDNRVGDQSVEFQLLKEALTFAEHTGQTERNAKSLATTHDRAELLGLSQAALQEGDLLKALTCVKAVLYRNDATTGDLSNLAQIYRRQGADDVEFLTLRGMLYNRHLTSVSEFTRLAELSIKLGVDSPLVGDFLRRLSEVEIKLHQNSDDLLRGWAPQDAWQRLGNDLWFEIAVLSRDVQTPALEGSRLKRLQEVAATYPSKLPLTDPLLKARIALAHNQFNMASQLAEEAYNGATDPMLQQRALLIGLEAVVMTAEGRGLNDDNVKNWVHHSFTLSVTPEALLILQAAHAKADFFQLSTLSSEVDELIPYPTYDSLVTQGILTSELFTEHGLDSDQELAAARFKFEAAIKLDPTRPEALCGLGALEERSNPVKAAEYFKKALTMWPSHAEAQRGHERCQARLNTPASYVPNLEITRPLENPPAALLEEALGYFGAKAHRELNPEDIAHGIRDFLRTKSQAFRELEDDLAPGEVVHTLGERLRNALVEVTRLAVTLQKHPDQHVADQVSNTISAQVGALRTLTSAFSLRLKVLTTSAKQLEYTPDLLRTPVRCDDMQNLLVEAESNLGKLEEGVSSPQSARLLAEFTAWADNASKTVQAINSDLNLESAALAVWSQRFAATILEKLRGSAATSQPTTPASAKKKAGKQSSNQNSDSREIVLTR